MEQFMHVDTKEIVRIVNDEENFLVLNNGTKIDKQLFSQKYAAIDNNNENNMNAEEFLNQKTKININPPKNNKIIENNNIISPSDSIDPIDFLNSTKLGNVKGLNNIKKIDTTKFLNVPEEQRVQIKNNLEENEFSNRKIEETEKQKLLNRYKNQEKNNQEKNNLKYVDENDPKAIDNLMESYKKSVPVKKINENGLTEAQEIMRQQQIELTGKDPYKEKIKKYRTSKRLDATPVSNPKIIDQNTEQTEQSEQQNQNNMKTDPTIDLFKKFKRNYDINITFNIKDKISKPDFIKVMADGLEGDIIEYYTNEIFNSLMSDVKKIKKDIYNQIHKKVYNKLPSDKEDDNNQKETTTFNKKKKRLIPSVPKEDRSQLPEGVNSTSKKGKKKTSLFLIPGKQTKTGKKTFKYINNKGKVVDMIPKNAEKKGYKPAIKDNLK